MKLLFVRHASAVDPLDFRGDDLLRPLTEEGIRKARKLF
jgi:phosphohistidine phosphatase SixA